MLSELYPLKFEPILKDKIWGGQKLKSILNKNSNLSNLGESWEISDVPGDVSIVINGSLSGQSLGHLLSTYKADLIGKTNYDRFSEQFPLLIKFIDAKENLSIQLHPKDDLAKSRHNSFGKTEMWYVMQADEDAKLIVGFKDENISLEDYKKHLDRNNLIELLNVDKVKKGDTYFIESGRVHAIGGGVLLAEIQQTSDITYRLYDYNRKDSNGNIRELHTELALDALDFNMKDDFRINYEKDRNTSNPMVSCDYFKTNYLNLSKTFKKFNEEDSFLIYICTEGAASFSYNQSEIDIRSGETILIPASLKEFEIRTESATFLEVYI